MRTRSSPRPSGHFTHSGAKLVAFAFALAASVLSACHLLSELAPSALRCLLLIGGIEPNPGPMQHSLVLRKLRQCAVGEVWLVKYQTNSGDLCETQVQIVALADPKTGAVTVKDTNGSIASLPDPSWVYYDLIHQYNADNTPVVPATDPPKRDRSPVPSQKEDKSKSNRSEEKGSPSRTHRPVELPPNAKPPLPPTPAEPPASQPKKSAAKSKVTASQQKEDDANGPEIIVKAPVHLPALPPPAPAVSVDLKPLASHVPAEGQKPSAVSSGDAPPTIVPPRAFEPADVFKFRETIPQVSYLPRRLERNWAQAISSVIKGYVEKCAEERNIIVRVLLRCPAVLLPQSSKRMGDRSIPILSAAEIDSAATPQRRQPKSADPEERQRNRATSLAVQGYLSRAVSTLMRDPDPVVVTEDEKVTMLCKLHPKRVEVVESCIPDTHVELNLKTVPKKNAQISEPQLKAEIRRWCSGKAAGPSGWTEELIRDAITAETVPDWMALFEDIINASLDSESLRLLRRCNLLGIPKKPSGIRPLAMGETLVKVAVKLLLAAQKELFNSAAVGGFQYAFQKCGVEQIIHQVRELIRPSPISIPSQPQAQPQQQQNRHDDESDTAADVNAPARINHAVLVDCTNAFNTIRRQAIGDVLRSDPKFNSLRNLFNAFYAEQGELIIRSDAEEGCPVIASSEGVRQGDVLGPLFFCLALKPAIENTIQRFSTTFEGLGVPQFFAYMDDVTIVGEEKACINAFVILKKELETLSLMVNDRKTVTTSKLLAEGHNCEVADCFKLLGAFVGRAQEKEKAAIDLLPQTHANLFNRLPLLPAEIGYRLLTKCGVPRWAHLIRTHEPDVVKPASKVFTEMSVRCLCAILKVDYDHMDELTYRQIRLPIRHGGLGLHDWSERAEDAYEASLNNESRKDYEDDPYAPVEVEDTRVDVVWEETLEALKIEEPTFAAHLKRNATKIASSWLQGEITVASAQPSNAFRAAMLFRLRWAGAHPDATTPYHCRCGFPNKDVTKTTVRDMVMHLAGCTKNGGPTKRHHFVRDALAGLMTRAGYATQTEVNLDAKGELRMDIVATPPNGPTLYIDTTVANSACRSHVSRSIQKVLDQKDAEKKKRYQETATAKGATYMTFAMDIFGHMSRESHNFLSMLTGLIKTRADPELQTAFTHAATINKFSKALAFGNGNCLLFSHQLRMFGVHLNAAPTTITAPPQLISAPLDLAPVVDSPTDFFAPPGHSKSDAIDVEEEDDDDEATAEENTRPAPASSQAPLARPPPTDAPPAETPPPVRISFRVKMLTATDLAPPQQQHAPPPAPPPTHTQQVTYAPSQAHAQPPGPAPPQGNTQANARAPHMDRTPLPSLPTTATTGATNPVAPAASAWQTPLERTRFQAPAGMQAAARNRVLNLSSK